MVELEECAHLQVSVERHEASWGEGEAEEVRERIPIPELTENERSDYGKQVRVAGATLHLNARVATACVHDALSQNGAELSHDVIVLVTYHFRIQLAVVLHLKNINYGKDSVVLHEDIYQEHNHVFFIYTYITLGAVCSLCCTRIMADAMSAPCRT